MSSSRSPNRDPSPLTKTKSPPKKSPNSSARKESRDKMAKYHTRERTPEQPNELDPKVSEVQRYVSDKRLKRSEQNRSTSNNPKMYSSLYGSYEPVLKDRQYLSMVHGDRSSSHRRNKSYTGEKPFHYNSSQNMHRPNHSRSKSGLFASTKTLTPVVQDNFVTSDEKSYRARMVKEYITPTNKSLYLSQTSAKKSREKTVRKVRDMVRVSQSNYDIQEKEQKYLVTFPPQHFLTPIESRLRRPPHPPKTRPQATRRKSPASNLRNPQPRLAGAKTQQPPIPLGPRHSILPILPPPRIQNRRPRKLNFFNNLLPRLPIRPPENI